MMNAAPTPATARATMICIGLSRIVGANEARPKIGQADEQCAAAPVSVADGARGQQQAGQHQCVAVDDPGELGLSRRGLQCDVREALR